MDSWIDLWSKKTESHIWKEIANVPSSEPRTLLMWPILISSMALPIIVDAAAAALY